MSEWQTYLLGDLTINHDGKRKPVKEADRRPGPYPYYGASGVVDYVDDYLIDGDYLLIAEDGENLRTRQTPIAFMARGKSWVNNHAHIVTGNDKADTRFLMYALQGVDVGAYLTGAVMPKLTQGNLNRLPILRPPLDDQRAIAHILGTLDDKIELNRRMNETLEAMARAIFKSWFVDFDPVRAKASGEPPESICRRLGLTPDVLALFPDGFQDSELGKIPAGWRIGRLDDLCQLKRGHDLPANARIPGDVPVVSSSGVSGKHTEAKASGPGVITGRYGTIGKVFYIEDDYWPLNTTLYVEDFKENPPRFVFHVLEQVDFSIYTDKAAVPGVNRNHLHMELTSIPPPRVRQSFARTVAALWSKHAANERQSRVIATLRDALLPRLLSGELPIPQGSH